MRKLQGKRRFNAPSLLIRLITLETHLSFKGTTNLLVQNPVLLSSPPLEAVPNFALEDCLPPRGPHSP